MIRRYGRWLYDDWFAPDSPANLGFCRLLIYAVAFIGSFWQRWNYEWLSGIPMAFYKPVWLFEILRIPVLSETTVRAMHMAMLVSFVMACAGLLTRVACAASFLLSLYLFGLQDSWGKIGHGEHVLTLVFLVMALSRCGDAWSLDALVRSRKKRGQLIPRSGEYRWPIRAIWLGYSLFFFAAGYSKARHGLEWITSDSLRHIMIQHHQMGSTKLGIGLWLSQYPVVCKLMAAATVLIEIAFPLVLLHPIFRRFLPMAGMLMQIGIAMTMGLWFTFWLVGYLFFFPWDAIANRVARSWPAKAKPRAAQICSSHPEWIRGPLSG